jgi:hypothetical protein
MDPWLVTRVVVEKVSLYDNYSTSVGRWVTVHPPVGLRHLARDGRSNPFWGCDPMGSIPRNSPYEVFQTSPALIILSP